MRNRKNIKNSIFDIRRFDEAFFNEMRETLEFFDENAYELYKYLIYNSNPSRYMYITTGWDIINNAGRDVASYHNIVYSHDKKMDSAESVYSAWEPYELKPFECAELHISAQRIALYEISTEQMQKYFWRNSVEELSEKLRDLSKKLGEYHKFNVFGDEFFGYSCFTIAIFKDKAFIGLQEKMLKPLCFKLEYCEHGNYTNHERERLEFDEESSC